MKQTNNFFLKLFEGMDKFDYKVVNENWQKIDDAIDELLNGGNIAVLPTMTIEGVEGGYSITITDAKSTQTLFLPKAESATINGVNALTIEASDGINAEMVGDTMMLSSNVKVETGTYAPTNKSGSANPNTLTFSFKPKIWGVIGHYRYESYSKTYKLLGDQCAFTMGWLDDVSNVEFTFYPPMYPTDCKTLNVTFSGNTVSWYHADNAGIQANYPSSNAEYYYFAIG